MKLMTRSHLYGTIVALILTVFAVAASAQKPVPFKGDLQGTDSDTALSDTVIVVTSAGTGNATLIGKFSFTLVNTVDLIQGTEVGTAQFIAANGDMIFANISGLGVLTSDPDIVLITETLTITGGTGRFEGAQGTFNTVRYSSVVAFTTSGTFDGSASSPGSLH